MRTALLTGATGFLGRSLLGRLVADGWLVLVLLRDQVGPGKTKGRTRTVVSAAQRLEKLAAELGLADRQEQLASVSGNLADLDVATTGEQIRAALRRRRLSHINAVINCAGRLNMDHPGQSQDMREDIRQQNYATNVEGLRRLLMVIDRLHQARPGLATSASAHRGAARPPRVRVLRPSVVVGSSSSDGYMAFLRALSERTALHMARRVAKRPDLKLPFPGHAESPIDLVEDRFVIEATAALLGLDVVAAAREPAQPQPSRETIKVDCVLQMSTAYVHGRMRGLLREERLPAANVVQPENTYEASKGDAERVLASWLEGLIEPSARSAVLAERLRFNHLCSGAPLPLREIVAVTLRAFGWSDDDIAGIELVAPGAPFAAALAAFTDFQPVIGRVIHWLCAKRTPMLSGIYTNRPSGTTFDVENTRRDLAMCGMAFAPRPLSPELVRQLLAAPLAVTHLRDAVRRIRA